MVPDQVFDAVHTLPNEVEPDPEVGRHQLPERHELLDGAHECCVVQPAVKARVGEQVDDAGHLDLKPCAHCEACDVELSPQAVAARVDAEDALEPPPENHQQMRPASGYGLRRPWVLHGAPAARDGDELGEDSGEGVFDCRKRPLVKRRLEKLQYARYNLKKNRQAGQTGITFSFQINRRQCNFTKTRPKNRLITQFLG